MMGLCRPRRSISVGNGQAPGRAKQRDIAAHSKPSSPELMQRRYAPSSAGGFSSSSRFATQSVCKSLKMHRSPDTFGIISIGASHGDVLLFGDCHQSGFHRGLPVTQRCRTVSASPRRGNTSDIALTPPSCFNWIPESLLEVRRNLTSIELIFRQTTLRFPRFGKPPIR